MTGPNETKKAGRGDAPDESPPEIKDPPTDLPDYIDPPEPTHPQDPVPPDIKAIQSNNPLDPNDPLNYIREPGMRNRYQEL
jgi:hypothetical protein